MKENFLSRVKKLLGKAAELPSKFGVLCIRIYKTTLSPLFALLGCQCRFYPTCSEYTAQAIAKHGLFKGCILGACRILRCNPLCKGGLDPVPDKFSWNNLFSKRR